MGLLELYVSDVDVAIGGESALAHEIRKRTYNTTEAVCLVGDENATEAYGVRPTDKEQAAAKTYAAHWLEFPVPLDDLLSCIGWDRTQVVKNSYGAPILETTMVGMFDIDRADIENEWCASKPTMKPKTILKRLSFAMHDVETDEYDPCDLLWCGYQTGGGWRILFAPMKGKEMPSPDGEWFKQTAECIGCDPRYTELCREQKNWRMRLGPKPWQQTTGYPVAKRLNFFMLNRDAGHIVIKGQPPEMIAGERQAVWEFHDVMALNASHCA